MYSWFRGYQNTFRIFIFTHLPQIDEACKTQDFSTAFPFHKFWTNPASVYACHFLQLACSSKWGGLRGGPPPVVELPFQLD